MISFNVDFGQILHIFPNSATDCSRTIWRAKRYNFPRTRKLVVFGTPVEIWEYCFCRGFCVAIFEAKDNRRCKYSSAIMAFRALVHNELTISRKTPTLPWNQLFGRYHVFRGNVLSIWPRSFNRHIPWINRQF